MLPYLVPCPECGGHGGYENEYDADSGRMVYGMCQTCRGSGSVPDYVAESFHEYHAYYRPGGGFDQEQQARTTARTEAWRAEAEDLYGPGGPDPRAPYSYYDD